MKIDKNKILHAFIIICLISATLFIPACRQDLPADNKKQEEAKTQSSKDQSQRQDVEIQKKIEEQADTNTTGNTELAEKKSGEQNKTIEEEETMKKLIIESPAFENNEMIPSKYTCDEQNINPPLKISGVTEDVKSLVLIMDDPDAPAGTWVHWTIWNISPRTAEIAENTKPESALEGITSFRKPGYGGPCPPSGTHRYFFKLFALDIMLELDQDATAGDIENAMKGHILDSAELIGLYKRS